MQEEKRQWLCRMFLVFLMTFCLTVFAGSAFLAHADGYTLEEREPFSSGEEWDSLTVGSSEESKLPIWEENEEPEELPNIPDDSNETEPGSEEKITIGSSEKSDLTIGESEDLTIGMSVTVQNPHDDEVLKELVSIRTSLQIIVYYVIPVAVAVLLIYKFCIWFYKTFIDSAFL